MDRETWVKILAANRRTRDEMNLRIYRCPDISQSNRVRLSRIGVDRLMYWVAESTIGWMPRHGLDYRRYAPRMMVRCSDDREPDEKGDA